MGIASKPSDKKVQGKQIYSTCQVLLSTQKVLYNALWSVERVSINLRTLERYHSSDQKLVATSPTTIINCYN